MFFMFTATQAVLSIYLIKITFKRIKTTVYGSDEMKRRVLSSLIRKKEYEFVNIDELRKNRRICKRKQNFLHDSCKTSFDRRRDRKNFKN